MAAVETKLHAVPARSRYLDNRPITERSCGIQSCRLEEPVYADSTASKGTMCVNRIGSKTIADSAVVSTLKDTKDRDVFRNIKEDTDTVLVSTHDIHRIKTSSVILSSQDIARMHKEKEDEFMRNSTIANQRKAHMLKLEEERKKKTSNLTESEKIKRETDAMLLAKSAKQKEEALDQVKRMNGMMLYARCVTVRDGQKNDKAERLEEVKKENAKAHIQMIAKLNKENKSAEEQEARKAALRMAGATVLRSQIEERETERKIADELKDIEGKLIRKEAERHIQEDIRKAQKKEEDSRKLYAELMKANEENLESKRQVKILEKQEQAKIDAYMRMKALREEEYFEEQARVRRQREKEAARLLAMQEKATDKQASLDELRAQRVMEQVEKNWRAKEKAEAERLQKMNEDLAEAREQQKMLKVKRLADEARIAHIDFVKTIKQQKDFVEKLKVDEEKQRKWRIHHRNEILGQIRFNREKKERELKEKLEEGERARLRLKAEKQRLEDIRKEKLKQLEEEKVPPKYLVELAKTKIVIA